MNKKDLSKKNKLVVIGSARGVKRFYIVNKFIEKFPNAKVINTGNLLNKIIKNMGFKDLDSISLLNYYKIIEPVFVEIILSHLEHSDVILDTHFYYLVPGMSIKEILKFKNKISLAILVLVKDDKEVILEENDGEWFKDIKNTEEDITLNDASFEFYDLTFQSFVDVKKIYFNLKKHDVDEKIKNIGDLIKNE